MNTSSFPRLCALPPLLAFLAVACGQVPADPGPQKSKEPPKSTAKRIEAGKNVTLVIDGDKRWVEIQGFVCLREGLLELFLTRKFTKEHEAVVAADIDARVVHTALTAAGAEQGTPVVWLPQYKPATGTKVKVTLEYKDKDGKAVRVPAQQWIRNLKSKKNLEADWVFAGSRFFPHPEGPMNPPLYAANDGDVICVSNFENARLDLPVASPQDNADLQFEAHTDRIPPLETPVKVILEPQGKGKKK
jgi:hypothetical protein